MIIKTQQQETLCDLNNSREGVVMCVCVRACFFFDVSSFDLARREIGVRIHL